MRKLAIRIAFVSLGAIALAGCTTSGIGTGQSAVGSVGATFTYTQTGATKCCGYLGKTCALLDQQR